MSHAFVCVPAEKSDREREREGEKGRERERKRESRNQLHSSHTQEGLVRVRVVSYCVVCHSRRRFLLLLLLL